MSTSVHKALAGSIVYHTHSACFCSLTAVMLEALLGEKARPLVTHRRGLMRTELSAQRGLFMNSRITCLMPYTILHC